MNVVIFSGTTEGRKLSEFLSSKHINHEVCVATESGENVMETSEYVTFHVGRMDIDALGFFLQDRIDSIVIDATHPYAAVVTDNVRTVCDRYGISYMRLNRGSDIDQADGDLTYYEDATTCARMLAQETGNILLTTGSKELSCYTREPGLIDRLYVRVLPSVEAINLCQNAGISEKNIIAMYGPHTKAMNEAVMQQYSIAHMVTKDSGKNGGFDEKISAAKEAGIKIHVINRPDNAAGHTYMECVDRLCDLYNIEYNTRTDIQMKLVGIGPGSRDMMTLEAMQAISEADYLFGAKRMLEGCVSSATKVTEYLPEKIIECLQEINESGHQRTVKVVALFSGDTGLYSGATKLYTSLVSWGKCQSVEIIPGVSSFSKFAAAIGCDYTDAYLKSLHGKSKDVDNIKTISRLILEENRVFLLMSGKDDFKVLYDLIPEGFAGTIYVGYNISYDSQQIVRTNVNNLIDDMSDMPDGLFIVMIDSKAKYE